MGRQANQVDEGEEGKEGGRKRRSRREEHVSRGRNRCASPVDGTGTHKGERRGRVCITSIFANNHCRKL